MDQPTVAIDLASPVEHGGRTYTRLTFRKMKARDLVAGDLVTGDTRKSLAIFASMAGVPIGVMEELDADDFERVGMEAAPLMGKRAQRAMEALAEKMDGAS